MHIEKNHSNSCSLLVSIVALLGIVLLLLWHSEIAICAVVPKGDHGAAEMEYQMKQLSRLQPSVDVSEAPPDFDPVIYNTGDQVVLINELINKPEISISTP